MHTCYFFSLSWKSTISPLEFTEFLGEILLGNERLNTATQIACCSISEPLTCYGTLNPQVCVCRGDGVTYSECQVFPNTFGWEIPFFQSAFQCAHLGSVTFQSAWLQMLDNMSIIVWLLLRNEQFQFSLEVNWLLKNACHLHWTSGDWTPISWPHSAGSSLPPRSEEERVAGPESLLCARLAACPCAVTLSVEIVIPADKTRGPQGHLVSRWGSSGSKQQLASKDRLLLSGHIVSNYVQSCVRNSLK